MNLEPATSLNKEEAYIDTPINRPTNTNKDNKEMMDTGTLLHCKHKNNRNSMEEDLDDEIISEAIMRIFQECLSFTLCLEYAMLIAVTSDTSSRLIHLQGSIGSSPQKESKLIRKSHIETESIKSSLHEVCMKAARNDDVIRVRATEKPCTQNDDVTRTCVEGSISLIVDGTDLVFIQLQPDDLLLNNTMNQIYKSETSHEVITEALSPVELREPQENDDLDTVSLYTDQLAMQLFTGDSEPAETESGSNTKKLDQPDERRITRRQSQSQKKLQTKKKQHLKEDTLKNECKVCNKEFRTEKILRSHEKHCKDKPADPAEVVKVKIEKSPEKARKVQGGFKCEHCPMSYRTQRGLDKHSVAHSDARAFKCAICSKHFKRKRNLMEHLKVHMKKDELAEVDAAVIEVNKPEKPVRKNQPARCQICNKIFSTGSNLEKHMIIHTDERPFVCESCGKAFRRKSHLQEHMRTHGVQEVVFFCETCGAGFKTKRCFDVHMKIAHSDERPFVCEICNKGFKRKRNLIDHGRAHSDERLHMCDICGMKLKTVRGVEKHVEVVHCNEKNFACGVCGKRFALKRYVDVHMLVHSDVKNEVCEHCGAQFKDHRALRQHRIIHSGLRPFKCDLCGKSFTRKRHLQDHQVTHQDRKPHFCNICGKAFRHRGLLANHHRLHRSEKENHECPVCRKTFTPKCRLVRHINKVHKVEVKLPQNIPEIDGKEEIIVISEIKEEDKRELMAIDTTPGNVIPLDADGQERLENLEGIPMTFIITQGFPGQEFEVAANVQLQGPEEEV